MRPKNRCMLNGAAQTAGLHKSDCRTYTNAMRAHRRRTVLAMRPCDLPAWSHAIRVSGDLGQAVAAGQAAPAAAAGSMAVQGEAAFRGTPVPATIHSRAVHQIWQCHVAGH